MEDEVAHAFRPTIFSRERAFRLGTETLVVDDGGARRTIALAQVAGMRVYKQPGAGFGPAIRRAIVTLAGGDERWSCKARTTWDSPASRIARRATARSSKRSSIASRVRIPPRA
jgi:hypothetical protein